MASRNLASTQERNRRRDSRDKRYSSSSSLSESEEVDYRRIRVIQRNLVYAIGLPDSICTSAILESDAYFGKYGKVLKTIINKTVNPTSKTHRYTAYVTYQSQRDASLAILALDDYYISDRPLKVSYGTTKYCSYFLKKHQCPNLKDCYFLHKRDIENQLTVDDNSKQVFNKQLKIAMQSVTDYLDVALKKHHSNLKKDLQDSLFPGIQEAIQRLLDSGLITEEQFTPFTQDDSQQQQDDANALGSKSKKCTSVSTASSPVKQDFQPQSKEVNTVNVVNEDTGLCIDNMIHRYITNKIMKQSRASQSRFDFVGKSKDSLEDAQKLKKYIEVYIAPKN